MTDLTANVDTRDFAQELVALAEAAALRIPRKNAPEGFLTRVKKALSEKQPLSPVEWYSLLRAIDSDQFSEEDAKSLHQALDALVEQHQQQALAQDSEAEVSEHLQAGNEYPSPLLLTATEAIITKYRQNLVEARGNPRLPIENIVENWSDYSAELGKDIKSKTRKKSQSNTLEIAKILSFSELFQENLKSLRQAWSIQQDQDLIRYLAKNHRHYLQPKPLVHLMSSGSAATILFQNDLRALLFQTFPLLDESEDYGLIIAGLCFGLTPTDVLENWDVISIIASHQANANARIITLADDAPRLMSTFLTIAYLADYLMPESASLTGDVKEEYLGTSQYLVGSDSANSLPPIIQRWVRFARQQQAELKWMGIEDIPKAIKQLRGLPHSLTPSYEEPKIYIEITPETTLEQVQEAWSKVNRARISVWGQSVKKPSPRIFRTWHEFERDAALKSIFDALGDKATDMQVAKEYNEKHKSTPLSHHPSTSQELVKKVRHRWEDKLKKLISPRKSR